MKWVTREGAKVDRVACPWLITRFIDRNPEFLFVPAERVKEVAANTGAVPFDAPGVELGHRGGNCSFETIIEKYKLKAPALNELAKIVHGADVSEDIHIRPESAGLKAIADGMKEFCPDDHKKLELSFPIYDALYAYCKLKVGIEPREA